MDTLVTDVYILIFDMLHGYDLCRFSLTSKIYSELIRNLMPGLNIDLSDEYIDQPTLNFFKFCKSLNISECGYEGQEALYRYEVKRSSSPRLKLSGFDNLISLNMSTAPVDTAYYQLHLAIDDSSLVHLTKLTNVNLSGIKFLSDGFLKNLPTTLKQLNLDSCIRITTSGFEHLTNLEQLNAKGVNFYGEGTFSSLVSLRKIGIGRIGVAYSRDSPLYNILNLSSLSNLRSLGLETSCQESLERLLGLSNDIKELTLITEKVVPVDVFDRWTNLSILKLVHGGKPSWPLTKRSISNMKHLTYLKLHNVIIWCTDDQTDSPILQKLKTIKLFRCVGVSNIIKMIQAAHTVIFNSCPGLKDNDLKYFNRSEIVSLSNILSITEVGICHLKNVYKLSLDCMWGAINKEIVSLPRLRFLELNWNHCVLRKYIIKINDDILRNLYHLHIGDTDIINIKFETLKNLTKIGMRNYKDMKDELFLSLSKLEYLGTVELIRCNISAVVIGQLKQMCPDIYFPQNKYDS